MASCSQYAAAFGYQLYIVPVSACGVDLSSVTGGIQAGGFIDPTNLLGSNEKIEGGADSAEILAGDPGVNIVYDNDTNTTETVIRLFGLTNASLETDTGSETVTTYDTESKGFDQSVAVSKSWSLSLEGVSQFNDAGYKALRLLEQNAVAGALKVKIGRVGPTGTSEAIYGYATLTGFSESIEAGSIVSWNVVATGYGPYSIDLDNSGTINNVGPATGLSISLAGGDLTDGVYNALALDPGAATADVTVSGGVVTDVSVVSGGNDEYAVNQVLTLETPINGGANPDGGKILTISIQNPGAELVDGTFTSTNFGTSGSGAGAGASIEVTVSGGVVTNLSINSGGTDYEAGEVLTDADVQATANPDLGAMQTFTLTNGGAGYGDGTYPGVALTGGSGAGSAAATIAVVGGAVDSVTITNPGTGYVAGETLSADAADIGSTLGEILTTSINDGGSGYADGAYTGVALTGGGGSSATADINVTGGIVDSVTIVDAGTGYSAGQQLSADDADLGGNGGSGLIIDVDTVDEVGGAGLIITIDSVDENTGHPGFIPPTYNIDTVEAEFFSATQPQFTVTGIGANE